MCERLKELETVEVARFNDRGELTKEKKRIAVVQLVFSFAPRVLLLRAFVDAYLSEEADRMVAMGGHRIWWWRGVVFCCRPCSYELG